MTRAHFKLFYISLKLRKKLALQADGWENSFNKVLKVLEHSWNSPATFPFASAPTLWLHNCSLQNAPYRDVCNAGCVHRHRQLYMVSPAQGSSRSTWPEQKERTKTAAQTSLKFSHGKTPSHLIVGCFSVPLCHFFWKWSDDDGGSTKESRAHE